jgi:hypothetical protein
MPRSIQAAIWTRQAQWFLIQGRRRFGPTFTLEIAYEGTWVVVSDPEVVQQVFTGDPKVFHAGEGNDIQQEMTIVLRELVARRSIRPTQPAAERPFRRAITETPRRNAEVVLS